MKTRNKIDLIKSSNLEDIQCYILNMCKTRGFNSETVQDQMLLLTEELGELAKAVRKDHTKIGIDKQKMANYDTVESEVADVFIVLISLCNTLKIDLHKALIDKEIKNSTRIWN